MDEIKLLQGTEQRLREAAAGVADEAERHEMLVRTCDFLEFMQRVQQMPMVTRLCFYRAAFATYNMLRVNRQLGRRVGAFDKDVYTEIVKILSKLLVENGNSED